MFSRGRPPRTWRPGLPKILTDDQPALVIWQAGTVDALRGVEPEDFRISLDQGIDAIAAADADVDHDEHAVQSAHRIHARRFRLRRRHALGGRAARRRAVRSAWRSCVTGAMRARSTSMPRPRSMLWRGVFTNALAGPWRRRSSMPLISTPGKCKRRVDVDDQTNFQLVGLRPQPVLLALAMLAPAQAQMLCGTTGCAVPALRRRPAAILACSAPTEAHAFQLSAAPRGAASRQRRTAYHRRHRLVLDGRRRRQLARGELSEPARRRTQAALPDA